MRRAGRVPDAVPTWLLAVGPLLVLGSVAGLLYLSSPFDTVASMGDADSIEVLWMVGVIGVIAGIVPVTIGMLWFPFIRALDHRFVHAFLALSAGVLAFIAVQMGYEVVGHGLETERTALAGALSFLGFAGTFAAMYAIGRWRQRKVATANKSGLAVAYLVAVALGLHSVGEGLAIGVAFVDGEVTLVTMLVVGFVLHNVMEGPTIVAAVARERAVPPLRHFAAMGLLAGGPVVLGGWLGSLRSSSLLAAVCYAVAIGAIVQVLIEVGDLIRVDAEAIVTRLNAATFAVGIVLMFVLEDVIVEGYVVP